MRETGDPGCDNGGVSPTPAQQARAAAITAEITARLADVSFALPGTLADRMTRCGHRGCRCHADPPQPHGPYHQWTRKKNGKTAARRLVTTPRFCTVLQGTRFRTATLLAASIH